jgi:hypothetical protein
MESLDELSKTVTGKQSFFNHVFNFDDESKEEMMNIIQYAFLALIPVIIMNKSMQRFVPEADDEKGSVEVLAEILGQVTILFIGVLIIHRIITYIPTYSGIKYASFSVTNIILAVLVIILSLQTKLGEKVGILVDRLMEIWEGPKDVKQQKKGQDKGSNNVRVTQPISQGQMQGQRQGQNQMAMNQSLGTTSISSLPMQDGQDFNQMYQQDNTPLVNAATPGFDDEPMAANSGGAFASAFGGW